MPCIDPATQQLRPDSTCAKVRDQLDAGQWGSALYDFIWRKKQTEEVTTQEVINEDNGATNMAKQIREWLIIQQIGVQAETWNEAMALLSDGEVIAVTIQQRPPLVTNQPAVGGPPLMQPLRQSAQPVMPRELGEKQVTTSEQK